MSDTWKVEYRKLVAEHNVLVRENEQLKGAVARFLRCPFIKGENGLVLTMNWADIEKLADAHRKACGYE